MPFYDRYMVFWCLSVRYLFTFLEMYYLCFVLSVLSISKFCNYKTKLIYPSILLLWMWMGAVIIQEHTVGCPFQKTKSTYRKWTLFNFIFIFWSIKKKKNGLTDYQPWFLSIAPQKICACMIDCSFPQNSAFLTQVIFFELDSTTSRPPRLALFCDDMASKMQAYLFDPCVLRCYNEQRNESRDCAVLLGDRCKQKPLNKTVLLSVPRPPPAEG